MKRYLHLLIIIATVLGLGLIPGLSIAKDYPVTFLKETYKTQASGAGAGNVYHTWAVESEKGNRLLILTGEDAVKRQWLRDFVKTGTTFIIRVPSKETGKFESETIFKIDVTNIHPVDENFIGGKKKKKKKRR